MSRIVIEHLQGHLGKDATARTAKRIDYFNYFHSIFKIRISLAFGCSRRSSLMTALSVCPEQRNVFVV
jgi:hypothetical protein